MEKTKRQRRIIVSLSAALGVAGITAIVAPTMVAVLRQGSTGHDSSVVKIVFNAGQQGSFGGSATLDFTIEKGKALGQYITIANNSLNINDNYAFKGWFLQDGTKVTSETILNNDSTILANYINLDGEHVNLSFSVDSNTETLEGIEGWVLEIEKGQTLAEIGTLPTAKKPGYEFQHWVLTKGSSTPIEEDYPFDKDTTLYPYFISDSEKKVVTFNFVKLPNQEFSSESTIQLEFDKTEGFTWGQITNKPEVTQTDMAFAGWYKDYDAASGTFSNPWADDDAIDEDNCTAYARMIKANNCPIITFAAPTGITYTCTWYGNQIVNCTEKEVDWDTVAKPAPFRDATGDPVEGIKTDYYFKDWTLDETGKTHIDVPSTITNSITVYPEFSEKPIAKFVDGTDTDSVRVDPNLTWSTVNPDPTKVNPDPSIETTEGTKWFAGWKQVIGTGEEAYDNPLDATTLNSSIDFDYDIVPNYITNCHLIKFNTGVDASGTEITGFKYSSGNDQSAVPFDNPYPFTRINKPVPYADGYAFKYWEIDLNDGSGYQPVQDITEIPAAVESQQLTFNVRPVMETTFQITFAMADATQGSIDFTSQEWATKYTVSSSKEFKDMYLPNVTVNQGYQFQYWATKAEDGSFVKIEPNETFSEAKTIYAYCPKLDNAYVVNFHLLPTDDPESESWDGKYQAGISGTKLTILPDDYDHTPKFGEIPHATAWKNLHTLEAWTDANGATIEDSVELTQGGTGIDVYAKFKQNDFYHVISVLPSSQANGLPPYEIVGNDKVYVKTGEKLPYVGNTYFGVEIKAVGYKVSGWTLEDGVTEVTKTSTFDKDAKLLPKLEACNRQVILSNDGDDTIEGFVSGKTGFTVPNYGKLLEELEKQEYKPTKKDGSEFVKWQIKNGSVKTDIDENTVVTGTTVIVPVFRGESEFKSGTQPYFYDASVGKWAAITSCAKNEMEIRYPDGTASTKDKTTFNYEVRFGVQMTSLPDDFMYGCVNWNNGDALKFTMPTGLQTVGKNVLRGCSSFNKTIEFPSLSKSLVIGDSFMSQCYSFDKDLNLSSSETGGTLTIGESFMYDCKSFTHTLNVKNRSIAAASTIKYCLCTSTQACAFTQTGFKVSCDDYDAFLKLFPLSKTSAPYRNYEEAK